MSTRLTHLRRPLAAAAVLATACVGTGAASAATSIKSAASGSGVQVSDAETVQVYMDPTGKLGMQHIYEQLVLTGHGKAALSNPIETSGLRNLDGFSGVTVKGGKQVVDTTVDGEKALRTVSNFHGKLPLTVKMSYTLDGKPIQPNDIVGKSGHLEVSYTVENVSGVPTTLTFDDGKGGTVTKTDNVPIPMVGSLSVDAPDTFRNVASKQASMGGDGHGGTMMQFTLTLLPPIGPAKTTFGYSADIKDGVLPRAELNALPVDPLTSPAFSGAASSYKGGADTGVELADGAMQMDAGLVKLRGGASDLVAGLIKLHNGAGQLSAGLKTSAVPGANKLADGTTKLDDGGKQLKSGADRLNGGLQQLKSKAPELGDGVNQIYAGQQALADGLKQLYEGVDTLPQKVQEQLKTNVPYQSMLQDVQDVAKGIGTTGDSSSALGMIETLRTTLKQIGVKYSDAQADLDDVTKSSGDIDAIESKLQGLATEQQSAAALIPVVVGGLTAVLKGQLEDAIGTPSPGCDPTKTLRCGAAALVDGGKQLADAVPQLTKGVNQLAAGSNKLAAGAGDLSDGLGQANDGAHQLASGLGDAADGAGQIHDGLGTARDGAPQIVDGAKQLSVQGSQKIAEAGASTAQSYGEMYAQLVAGAKRANTESMAIGAPAGATSLTAYDYVITGADGQGGRNASRSLLAGGLLVVGAGAPLLLRRRFGA